MKSIMLRIVLITGLVVILLSGLVIGCATPAPAPAPTAKPAPAPAPAPSPKPIILKVGNPTPERHVQAQFNRQFGELVTQKTGGRVQFEQYYGGVLGDWKNQVDNLKAGLFDIGQWIGSIEPAKTPLSNFYIQAWVPNVDVATRHKIYLDMYQLPALKNELAQWDCLHLPWAPMPESISYLYMAKKPVYKLDDLKGLKLMAGGGIAEAFGLIGGVGVVTMPWPDLYDALAKGVVEGSASSLATFMGYKLYEVIKYRTNVILGIGHPQTFIKLGTFNKLPSDVQKIIMDAAIEMWPRVAEEETKMWKEASDTFKARGMTVIDFPKEEQQKYDDLYAKPVIEKWIKEVEAKGLPARQVFEAYQATVKKYAK